ncbi:MAG: SDR family oxidoreductase [Chloroflexota bacterium]
MTENILSGKIALVTGASRGIGREIALALGRSGADVIVHYFRKKRLAEEVVKEIKEMGQSATAIKANLADVNKTNEMLSQIEAEYGTCDIFIGNAASGVHSPVLDITDKHWDWTMTVNARSILHIAKKLVPLMEKSGWGRIINISSLGSVRVVPDYGTVGLSKAVVEALTRYLAVDLAKKGIIVNAISPGLVNTAGASALPHNLERSLAHVKNQIPTGNLVTSEDIANVVIFLCSEAASMIVGQTIMVDGGYSLLTDYFLPAE